MPPDIDQFQRDLLESVGQMRQDAVPPDSRGATRFARRRYTAVVISDEEAAQRARLKYVLAHGAKEDLVDRPRDWPGVHAVRALLEDEPLAGLWFDRTAEYAAGREEKSPTVSAMPRTRP